VSQILVKERGWEPLGPPSSMKFIDGRNLHCYGIHHLSIRVRDAWGKTKEAKQTFYAIDSDEYKVVLGYPWLEHFDPDIAWKAKRFRYRINEEDFELQEPKEFKEAVGHERVLVPTMLQSRCKAKVEHGVSSANRRADGTTESNHRALFSMLL
jgi:hypothetical protein